jgi:hypothetical protein
MMEILDSIDALIRSPIGHTYPSEKEIIKGIRMLAYYRNNPTSTCNIINKLHLVTNKELYLIDI